MFQKDQVLRNKNTGCLVRVLNWPMVQRIAAPRKGRGPIGVFFTVGFKTRDAFNLIGNNYRPKARK